MYFMFDVNELIAPLSSSSFAFSVDLENLKGTCHKHKQKHKHASLLEVDKESGEKKKKKKKGKGI